VPEELRARPQWLIWRFGPRRKDGKRPKLPYSPRTLDAASVTPYSISSKNGCFCAQQAHAALIVLRRGYAAPQHNQFFCGRASLSHTLTVRSVVAGNKKGCFEAF